jgi:hypothetical protein
MAARTKRRVPSTLPLIQYPSRPLAAAAAAAAAAAPNPNTGVRTRATNFVAAVTHTKPGSGNWMYSEASRSQEDDTSDMSLSALLRQQPARRRRRHRSRRDRHQKVGRTIQSATTGSMGRCLIAHGRRTLSSPKSERSEKSRTQLSGTDASAHSARCRTPAVS